MHFIDDIDLVLSLRRGIGHFLPDLADVVHAVVGSGIDLNDIHGAPGSDRPAGGALPAGAAVRRMLAVHRLRKDLRNGRLAGASGPAEEIGMSHTVRTDLVL